MEGRRRDESMHKRFFPRDETGRDEISQYEISGTGTDAGESASGSDRGHGQLSAVRRDGPKVVICGCEQSTSYNAEGPEGDFVKLREVCSDLTDWSKWARRVRGPALPDRGVHTAYPQGTIVAGDHIKFMNTGKATKALLYDPDARANRHLVAQKLAQSSLSARARASGAVPCRCYLRLSLVSQSGFGPYLANRCVTLTHLFQTGRSSRSSSSRRPPDCS